MKISKANPLSHYKWGNNCDGWDFIGRPEIGIKQELMPANTSEKLHFHTYAEQFFFILKGEATFLIENEKTVVSANEGFRVQAGDKHKIMNDTEYDLEFILCSYPSTHNDRTNCE